VTGEDSEVTWPYVTVPFDQFEKHARHVTSFPYNGIAAVAPIVSNVTSWNKYCADVMSDSDIPMNPGIFEYDTNGSRPVTGPGPFVPLHQVYPTSTNGSIVNYDISSDPKFNSSATLAYNFDRLILSGLLPSTLIRDSYPEIFDATEPVSMLIKPIYSSNANTSSIVGYAQNIFKWRSLFSKFYGLVHSVYCTVENTCGESFSFVIDNHNVTFLDSENSTESWIKDVSVTSAIGIHYDNVTLEDAQKFGICLYTLNIYPSVKFREAYDLKATTYAVVVAIILVFNLLTFFAFD
jgi:hypothetical protein